MSRLSRVEVEEEEVAEETTGVEEGKVRLPVG